MKQLKFMLAAATAIGLATAAQAENKATSTGFERAGVGNVVTGTVDYDGAQDSYFYYDGEKPSDNESVIEAITEAPDATCRPKGYKNLPSAEQTQSKVLKINTAESPLLRTINPITVENEQWKKPDAVTLSQDTYVDTLVKFTVTPAADDPTPTPEDKLMVYLKESATDTEGVTVTNLVVKGGLLNLEGTVESADFIAQNVSVLPNKWYRLTVKAVANLGGFKDFKFPGFYVYIDNTLLAYDRDAFARDEDGVPSAPFDAYYAEDATIDEPVEFTENKVVFSLLAGSGSVTPTLQAVGFAGEGSVDDFIVTTDDPFAEDPSSVDFTFTGNYLSSVTYTIGEGENTKEYTWTKGATVLDAEATIKIKSIAFSDLYTVATDSEVKVGYTLTVNAAGMKFAVSSTALTGDDEAPVPSGTKPADIGIANTTIPATVAVANTTLDKMIKWAADNKGDNKTTISFINNDMKFDADGNPFVDETAGTTNVAAQAFLLNCALNQIETVKDAFKIEALTFDAETGLPVPAAATSWKDGNGPAVNFNGVPAFEYKASLKSTDSWGAVPESMTEEQLKTGFFRARLILK